MVHMSRRITLLVVALFVTGFISFALAQRFRGDHSNHKGHKGMSHSDSQQALSPTYPPGTIDGAKNPELITDFKAYEVFFNSVAVPEASSEIEKMGAEIKFRRANLSEKDAAALMKALNDFYLRRTSIAGAFDQLAKNGGSEDAVKQLHSEATNLVSSAQQEVQAQLSTEGAHKLHEHVMGLKSKIKILPPPDALPGDSGAGKL